MTKIASLHSFLNEENVQRCLSNDLQVVHERKTIWFNNTFELLSDIIHRDWNLRVDQIRLQINQTI